MAAAHGGNAEETKNRKQLIQTQQQEEITMTTIQSLIDKYSKRANSLTGIPATEIIGDLKKLQLNQASLLEQIERNFTGIKESIASITKNHKP